jgi:hypothetical protein
MYRLATQLNMLNNRDAMVGGQEDVRGVATFR